MKITIYALVILVFSSNFGCGGRKNEKETRIFEIEYNPPSRPPARVKYFYNKSHLAKIEEGFDLAHYTVNVAFTAKSRELISVTILANRISDSGRDARELAPTKWMINDLGKLSLVERGDKVIPLENINWIDEFEELLKIADTNGFSIVNSKNP